jgi:hypothetical protein
MKQLPAVLGSILFVVCLALLLGSYGLESSAQPASSPSPSAESRISDAPDSPGYQLLVNPGVEVYDAPYTHFEGVNCQVASGWQRFWDVDLPEPYWMDCRVFASSHLGTGWVESIEGSTSQLVVATQPYTAGIRQTVTGLTPGVGYGFHAAMLTIYRTSAPPDEDGSMIKQVGMDPTGGTDPDASSVVWCDPDDNDEGPWSIDLRTAAFAESPTMTVFIRVISPYPSGGLPHINLSFLDSAILALTPVVTATSPAVSEVPTFTVNWDNAVAAPGLTKLKWRDVQWLDEEEGVWHDWITRTYEVEAPFGGEPGHAYRFRARVWQKYANGAHLYGPYRPNGDTRTVIAGPRLAGQVLTAEGHPLAGATVAISGTAYSTTSGAWGRYGMSVPSGPDIRTITVSHPLWQSPPPVYGVTFGPTDTVAITWTLRPLADALVNGQFEAGLDGWSVLGEEMNPTVVTEPVHSGLYALELGGALPMSGTAGVSQTLVLTDAWEPTLSFWYRPVAPDPDDLVLTVAVTVVTQAITPTLPVTPTIRVAAPLSEPITSTVPVTTSYVFTPDLETGGWHHQWYPVGPPEAYLTATVTIEFQVWRSSDEGLMAVYLDETSLGATPGGPNKVYVPLVAKQGVTSLSTIPAFRPNMIE